MKIKNILYLLVVLAMVFTSCDDYLDVMPDSRTELDSEEKIKRLLASAYPSYLYVYPTEMYSDNTDWRDAGDYTSNNITQEELFEWKDVTEDTGSDSPQSFWSDSYSSISAANHALRAIEEFGNPRSLQAQRGEALLVRAYNHFNLVNVFGKHYSEKTSETDLGVPYATEPERTVNPHYERQTVAEVYRLIEKDLLEGLPLIDDNEYTVPKYHFNRRAANAFAVRFYLYSRNYDKVIEHANALLGNNPQEMLRNMQEFTTMTSDFQLRAKHYVKMEHNANLLVATLSNYIYQFGNYSSGKKYAHTRSIASNETTMSPAPWTVYNEDNETYVWNNDVYYLSPSNYTQYVASPKIPYYFQITDPIAQTGYRKSILVLFSADEALLSRAEAYIMKEDYDSAIKDMNLWVSTRSKTGNFLDRALVNKYYSELNYYTIADATPKKKLNPEVPVVSAEQENFLHCILHIRRIETIHEGLRWFDIKRYGIEIYRRLLNTNENVTELDFMPVDDPRRALQIPATVISAGLKPNPR